MSTEMIQLAYYSFLKWSFKLQSYGCKCHICTLGFLSLYVNGSTPFHMLLTVSFIGFSILFYTWLSEPGAMPWRKNSCLMDRILVNAFTCLVDWERLLNGQHFFHSSVLLKEIQELLLKLKYCTDPFFSYHLFEWLYSFTSVHRSLGSISMYMHLCYSIACVTTLLACYCLILIMLICMVLHC